MIRHQILNAKFSKVMFIIFTLSSIMLDLPMKAYYGTLFSSPMIIVSSFSFLAIIFLCKGKIYLNEISKLYLIYFLMTFLSSLIILLWSIIPPGGAYTPYEELKIIKLLKSSSYNFVYFMLVLSLSFCVERISLSFMGFLIKSMFFSLIIIGFAEFFKFSDFSYFHNNNIVGRVRLLTSEPSIAAFLLNVLGMLSLIFSRSSFQKIMIIISMLIMNVMISSKASLLILFIAFCYAVFIKVEDKNIKNRLILLLMIISPFILWFIYFIIIPSMIVDIAQFTSVSTRLVTSLWAVISLFYYPFGEGYGTYLNYFSDQLLLANELINNFLPINVNFSELKDMIDTGLNVSAKSGILSQVIYNGFFAVFFYVLLYKKTIILIEKIENQDIKFCYCIIINFIFLSMLFVVNTELTYIYVFPIVICYRFVHLKKDDLT